MVDYEKLLIELHTLMWDSSLTVKERIELIEPTFAKYDCSISINNEIHPLILFVLDSLWASGSGWLSDECQIFYNRLTWKEFIEDEQITNS